MARKKKEVSLTSTGLPADYLVFLESLKNRVQQAQTKAMLQDDAVDDPHRGH